MPILKIIKKCNDGHSNSEKVIWNRSLTVFWWQSQTVCDVTWWSHVTMRRGSCVITRRVSENHSKHDVGFVRNLSFCDFLNVTILQSLCENFTWNKISRYCFSRITYVQLILSLHISFFASILIICERNITLFHNERKNLQIWFINIECFRIMKHRYSNEWTYNAPKYIIWIT